MKPEPSQRVVHQVASLLLRHPDAELMAALPAVQQAIEAMPERPREPLATLAAHLAGAELWELASQYTETFDFARKCSLYLTYYAFGDTRQRGPALLRFTAAYRAAGLELDTGELPDYLPLVLEFCATGDAASGMRLLASNRASLDVLYDALEEAASPYAHAVEAVRRTLPAANARDTALAAKLRANGPPTEDVGLEPYSLDPELLSGSHR